MTSCCGLDCSECEAYLATQADDDDQRVETAKEWTARYKTDIKPEHINCDGCRTQGRKFFYCADICELRKCCLEKNMDNCAVCDKYVCDKLKKFFKQAPQVRAALEKLRG